MQFWKYIVLVSIALMTSQCGDPEVADQPTRQQNMDSLATSDLDQINEDMLADPDNPNHYYRRANYYFDNKQIENAINDMNRALAIDSTVATFHFKLGEIQYAKGDISQSRTSFEKAIEYDPVHVDALLKLGELALLLRDYQLSLDYLDRALEEDQYKELGYYIKGFVFKEVGDSAKAASSFKTAVELNSDFYDAYIQLGILYGEAANNLAVEYFNSAINVQPSNTEAYYLRGMFCQEHNMPEIARDSYKAILLIDGNDVRAHHNLGYLELLFFGDMDAAVSHFTKAIELVPGYVEAWHNRGRAFEKMGYMSEAEKDYRQALKLKPDFDLSAKALSRVLSK